jgi:hypothetical protein
VELTVGDTLDIIFLYAPYLLPEVIALEGVVIDLLRGPPQLGSLSGIGSRFAGEVLVNGATIFAGQFQTRWSGAEDLASYTIVPSDKVVQQIRSIEIIMTLSSQDTDDPYPFLASEMIATFDQAAAVPEPSTWAMLLIGFAGICFASRRRRQSNQKPQYVC